MKGFPILCLSLFLFALPVAAQDETDLLEEEMPRAQHGLVGGGGGVVPAFLFLKMDDLNASLAQGQIPALNGSGMFLMGGAGFFYPGLIKNLRIGGIGAGGSIENSSSVATEGVTRSAKFAMSYGGVTLEYVIPFGNFHVAVGGMVGGGSMTITLTSKTASMDWNELIKMFGSRTFTNLMRHELSRSYLAYQPTLSLEYVPHPIFTARLTGGFYGTSGGGWKLNDDTPVSNAPELKPGGAFIQIGLFVGAFLSN